MGAPHTHVACTSAQFQDATAPDPTSLRGLSVAFLPVIHQLLGQITHATGWVVGVEEKEPAGKHRSGSFGTLAFVLN